MYIQVEVPVKGINNKLFDSRLKTNNPEELEITVLGEVGNAKRVKWYGKINGNFT